MLEMFKKHLEQHEFERLLRHCQSGTEGPLLRTYLTNKLVEQMDISKIDSRHPNLEASILGRKYAAQFIEETIQFLLETPPEQFVQDTAPKDRRIYR